MMRKSLCAAVVAACLAAPVLAGEASWPGLQQTLYSARFLAPAGDLIAIDAPYRSDMDSRTRIGATVTAPEGTLLDRVTVILDENPMPVSAVFAFAAPLPAFVFDVTLRVNGPTPLHVVAETADGRLLVAEGFVKTSGQGACAAPPGTDPAAALASLGEMVIEVTAPDRLAALLKAPAGDAARLDLDISHPSHSGMQMDQISLLFIPARYVDRLQIDLDGRGYVDVTGSISLSENPRLSVSVPRRSRTVDVTLTDTDGTVTKAHKAIADF